MSTKHFGDVLDKSAGVAVVTTGESMVAPFRFAVRPAMVIRSLVPEPILIINNSSYDSNEQYDGGSPLDSTARGSIVK